MVAALAVTLVIVRNSDGPGPVPAPVGSSSSASGSAPAISGAQAVAAIPRYFAVATQKNISHIHHGEIDVTVGDVRTGKTVATAVLPSNDQSATVGVSAASDDRSFVVGRRTIDGGLGFFLVQFDPAKKAATFRPLPVPAFNPGEMLGFAVSPNARELAVLSVRGDGTTVATYSVTTGATLRTWTAGAWKFQGNGVVRGGVSWTADSRQVAFTTGVSKLTGPLVERVISTATPSGDLAAGSRVIFAAPGSCTSLLLTPGGGAVVCGTTVNYPGPVPPATAPGCGAGRQPMFVSYSVATGRQAGIAYQYPGACSAAVFTVLWADNSGRHVIGETQMAPAGQGMAITGQYGVASAGTFTKLPVPALGQWSGQPAW
jgi:hypothetical protein